MAAMGGLFLSAFLAATILPFSSEAVLATLTVAGGFDAWLLWAVATAGNLLGAVLNMILGRWCLHWQDRKWFPVGGAALVRAQAWFQRYGVWSLLFAWVPIIGDPLTVAAGLARSGWWLSVALIAIGKGGRYAVVMMVADRVAG